MSRLTIIANIHARPAQVSVVRKELEKLLPLTRAEEGCVTYDLIQDNTDPAHFMLYEVWENRALWLAHTNAPHLDDYMAATDGAVTEFILHEMTKIG